MADAVQSYSVFGIFIFQLVMFGFFTSIFGKKLTSASFVLIVGEIIFYIVKRLIDLTEMTLKFEEFDLF